MYVPESSTPQFSGLTLHSQLLCRWRQQITTKNLAGKAQVASPSQAPGLTLWISPPRSLRSHFPDCSFLSLPVPPQCTLTEKLLTLPAHTMTILQNSNKAAAPFNHQTDGYDSGFVESTIWIWCCKDTISKGAKFKSKESVLKILWRHTDIRALGHSSNRRVSL